MTETTTVEKKNTFPKVFIGIIAFLAGVAVGGAALYLFSYIPQKKVEAELEAKTLIIDSLEMRIDSLHSQLEGAKEISPRYEAILRSVMQPDTLNQALLLGAAVGGKWQVLSVEDVTFLTDDLVYIEMEDGHFQAQALLRIQEPNNTKTWRQLWADYKP